MWKTHSFLMDVTTACVKGELEEGKAILEKRRTAQRNGLMDHRP